MKKIIVSVLCTLLTITPAFASGIDWSSMTDQQIIMALAEGEAELDNRESADSSTTAEGSSIVDDFLNGVSSDESAKADIRETAVEAIESYSRILNGGVLDDVSINVNYGTMESGDFLASVYMTYGEYTDPRKDMNNITSASATIAYAVGHECPQVVEVTVYWELPGYGSSAKVNLTIDEDGEHFGDAMFPKVMADAQAGR